MSDTITMPRDEFAAYQRAVEYAKNEIARLTAEVTRLREEVATLEREIVALQEREGA